MKNKQLINGLNMKWVVLATCVVLFQVSPTIQQSDGRIKFPEASTVPKSTSEPTNSGIISFAAERTFTRRKTSNSVHFPNSKYKGNATLATIVKSDALEQCTDWKNRSGVCQPVLQCDVVLQELRDTRPRICFYRGNVFPHNIFVCCPHKKASITTLTGETNAEETPDMIPERKYYNVCGESPTVQVRMDTPYLTRFFIKGGVPAEPNAWPWMALLGASTRLPYSPFDWFCGGSLITDRHIVTAAHCFVGFYKKPDIVRLGEHDLSTQTENDHKDMKVQEVTLHPDFSFPALYNDIAIVTLRNPVTITKQIRPVCLPVPDLHFGEDSIAVVMGWGTTDFGLAGSDILQEVRVPAVDVQDCEQQYIKLPSFKNSFPAGFTPAVLCAGEDDGGKDACQGDSGGPLVQFNPKTGRYHVMGVVSSGAGCGIKDFPGLYANASNYMTWIRSVIRIS